MTQYLTDRTGLSSEVFDGEVVIADFVSGSYFSVTGMGASVWQTLRAGLTESETVAFLASFYSRTVDELKPVVSGFIGQLKAEGLILPAEQALPVVELTSAFPPEFTEPTLDRFDDLKDLLLLDPVHDVSEAGWPHLPSSET